jgi:hypothetical protein
MQVPPRVFYYCSYSPALTRPAAGCRLPSEHGPVCGWRRRRRRRLWCGCGCGRGCGCGCGRGRGRGRECGCEARALPRAAHRFDRRGLVLSDGGAPRRRPAQTGEPCLKGASSPRPALRRPIPSIHALTHIIRPVFTARSTARVRSQAALLAQARAQLGVRPEQLQRILAQQEAAVQMTQRMVRCGLRSHLLLSRLRSRLRLRLRLRSLRLRLRLLRLRPCRW